MAVLARADIESFDRDGVNAGLEVCSRARGLVDATRARLARRSVVLAQACPSMLAEAEADIAVASRSSRSDAGRDVQRAAALDEVPELEPALAAGEVSVGHVDVLQRALKRLQPEQRELLAGDGARLAAIAARSTPEEFDRILKREVARLDRREGEDTLGRQQRANRLRWWTDADTGMVRLAGEFDPESGLLLMGRIENTVEAMFHAGVPDDCPAGEGRQDYLRAMALIALLKGQQRQSAPASDNTDSTGVTDPTTTTTETSTARSTHSGPFWDGDLAAAGDRAEVIVVIDLDTLLNGLHDRSIIDNGHGVDLPVETYRRLACEAAIIPVVLNGDGVALDEGRQRRLATRSQRRALRAMYATCAIPGCRVNARHCEPHHVTFFTGGFGPTDLANLLPVCSRHHHALHEGGWKVAMHADRSLTITYPDGTVQTTGPPGHQRRAA